MANITIDPKSVRPLPGANVSMVDAGEAMSLGDYVYLSDEGIVSKTDATDPDTLVGQLGMAVGVSNYLNGGAIAEGERLTVCWFGRVSLPGAALDVTAQYYVSDDAGKVADAAGTYARAAGSALAEDIFFVNPDTTSAISPE